MNRSRLAGLLAAAVIAAVLLLSLRGRGDREKTGEAFRYDLKAYAVTDPGLVAYRETRTLPLGSGELGGLALDGRGNVYVAVAERLLLFDMEGNEISARKLSGPPGAIATGPSGEVYLGMGDHIEALLPGGETRVWTSLGEKAIITSLAAGGTHLFAADAGSRLVWRFDTQGRLLGNFGRRNLIAGDLGFIVPSPYFDLALGPSGELWVVNPGRLEVGLYSAAGRLIRSWGRASLAVDGFGGCCNPSHIAISPDGSFVTSEKGLPRVKIYGPDGSFQSVVAGPEAFRAGTADLDLAVDPAGRVLVLDPSRQALRVFEPIAAEPARGDDGV